MDRNSPPAWGQLVIATRTLFTLTEVDRTQSVKKIFLRGLRKPSALDQLPRPFDSPYGRFSSEGENFPRLAAEIGCWMDAERINEGERAHNFRL